jgi:hypothetical protein
MKRSFVGFALLVCVAQPAHAYYPEWPRTYFAYYTTINSLLAADFNEDGRPDLVARTTSHLVLLALAKPDRTFATPLIIYTGDYLTDMAVGDANGDGRADVIVSDTATNRLVMLPSNGDATFGTPIVTALALAPTEIDSADFNDDGDVDIALRSFSGMTMAAFTNDGAGHFAETWRSSSDETTKFVVGGDIDGDGADDFLVHRSIPSYQYVMFFGRNDGTFDPPVVIPAGSTPYRVALGDLDADGDLEIVSVNQPSSVSVLVNTGSRTFGAPSNYSTFRGSAYDAINLVIAEVTGDEYPDVVAVLLNSNAIATLAGNGNGTLGTAEYAAVPRISSTSKMFPQYVTAADFTADGRADLAIAGYNSLALFANASGDITMTLKALHPTISTGQTARYEVRFGYADDFDLIYPEMPPFPAGTISLKNEDTPIATGSFNGSNPTIIEVPSLPLGTHTITASYADDVHYRPQTMTGVSQKVVTDRTTIELTASTEGQVLPYGQQFTLAAHVVSPLPGSTDGAWYLYTNGERSQYTENGTAPQWSVYPDDVGTYEYYVSFEGSETQPPATSNVVRQTVVKAQSTTEIWPKNLNTMIRYGTQPELRVDLRSNPHGLVPEGILKLYDGSTLLATKDVVNDCCSGGITVAFDLPVLSEGVHYIHAKYEGNERFTPSASDYERYTVLPAEGFVLDAYAAEWNDSRWIDAEGLFTRPPNGRFVIYQKIGNQPWTVSSSFSFYPSLRINNPIPNVVYAFRMEVYDGDNNLVASSNADAAMIVPFTDRPLAGGLTIKAQHVQELISATNILRSAAGLSPLTINDVGVGQKIRMTHLITLRNSFNAARTALGLPRIAFTDVTEGSIVQARHFQEMRDAMQ